MALMMEMQSNPRVMEAAMDIAMNGEAAAEKYTRAGHTRSVHRVHSALNDATDRCCALCAAAAGMRRMRR